MIKVSCPKCKNVQNYLPQKNKSILTDKVKQCVYCGHSFKIHSNIEKSRIVEMD